MHNHICLRTPVISTIERHDPKPFRLSLRLEQMKSLKLLSHLIPHLSVFSSSDNYPVPSTLADCLFADLTGTEQVQKYEAAERDSWAQPEPSWRRA